jgi:integral membrane protein (TIGR01906 family)
VTRRFYVAALSFLCCVFVLFGVTAEVATSEGLLKRGFLRFADSPLIEREDYTKVAEDISAYLSGKSEFLSSGDIGYSQRESLHMADVKGLVIIGRRLLLIGLLLPLVLFVYLIRCKHPRHAYQSMLGGALAFAGMILAFGAAGLLFDFNRLFTAFHLVFFRNDLWVLDPKQDIIIGLMPLPFFAWASKVITCIYLLWLCAYIGGISYCFFRKSNGKSR